jgi:hypothetical protein
MASLPITRLRLGNQLIANSPYHSAAEVVSRLGAVQAQDYPAAKWAVGQRAQDLSDAAVEHAYNEGAILRTHVLRPTWHFVTPADIRWMLALTAPRVKAASAYYFRGQGLDQSVFSQANSILEKVLQGGKQLTRAELEPLLEQAGFISASDASLRFLYIIINAELDGIICSGARNGAQHTYALLEERVPGAPVLQREEALAGLAMRYFTSRAPATLKDFIWWSGLSGEQAKEGLALIRGQLVEEKADGKSYWLNLSSREAGEETSPAVHLLPNYDEYIVGYTNRSAIYDPANVKKVDERGNFLFNHTIVIDGQVVGTWKRAFKKNAVEITPNPFIALSAAQTEALKAEMGRYSQFLGMAMVEAAG